MLLNLLSPEARLVLLSAGGPRYDAEIRALLAGPLNWERIFSIAGAEKVAAPFVRRLRSVSEGPLPPQTQRLQRLAAIREFSAVTMQHQLEAALHLLHEAKVEAVLLKGAALALAVYRSFADRPMGDVDLLVVDQARVREAWHLLARNGWKPHETDIDDSAYEGHHHLIPLTDTAGVGVLLEVHSGLFVAGHPFDLTPAMIRADAEPIRGKGWEALVPSPNHLLLFTCLHFGWAHFLQEGGSWRAVRDVDAIIAAGRVEWEAFTVLARRTRGATVCYWTLRLARDLIDVPVPEWVLAALRPPLPGPLLGLLARAYVSNLVPIERASPSDTLRLRLWEMGVMPRWSGHGASRPWHGSEAFAPAERPMVAATGSTLVGRLIEHARRLPRWLRYARTLMLPPQRAR